MDYTTLTSFFIIDIFLAFLIAKYQQQNGYKFSNSFVGTLIGLIGLTWLGIKAYMEFFK
ncbi:MAG: hypothetical protein J5I47_06485 [Vicingus serpentipes]|nr:hypothetical protein [Vicingus serpentipes]